MENQSNGSVLNSLLYLQDLQMKYINVYKDLIRKLYIYIDAICILSTGYLLINLIPPSQLDKMINQVKEAVIATNPECNMVLKRLHLYYDMKLVMFGINGDSDLIKQCPVFVQPHSQSLLSLYQKKIVTIPIIDHNIYARSYMELQISKPYIALNEETYISLRYQEL